MDWILGFKHRFDKDKRIANLKTEKFHGSLTLNFADGVVHACKKDESIRPVTYTGCNSQPLTEGGRDV